MITSGATSNHVDWPTPENGVLSLNTLGSIAVSSLVDVDLGSRDDETRPSKQTIASIIIHSITSKHGLRNSLLCYSKFECIHFQRASA